MDTYVACCLGPICKLPSWFQGILPSLLGIQVCLGACGRTYIEIMYIKHIYKTKCTHVHM